MGNGECGTGCFRSVHTPMNRLFHKRSCTAKTIMQQLGGKRILASGGIAPWTEILTRNRILIRIPAEPLFHQVTHSSSKHDGK